MLWLTLVRHAKSDWADDGQADADRPLAPRGQKSAPLMGRYLKALWGRPGSPVEGVPPPDTLLVSTSRRTRETETLFRQAWPLLPDATFLDQLYLAEAHELLPVIAQQPAKARHIMIIGHNDGLADLAQTLNTSTIYPDAASAFAKFPTAAVAIFALDIPNWRAISAKTGTMLDFMTPKRLARLKT
jgi:phosphohistidine phosphatase